MSNVFEKLINVNDVICVEARVYNDIKTNKRYTGYYLKFELEDDFINFWFYQENDVVYYEYWFHSNVEFKTQYNVLQDGWCDKKLIKVLAIYREKVKYYSSYSYAKYKCSKLSKWKKIKKYFRDQNFGW